MSATLTEAVEQAVKTEAAVDPAVAAQDPEVVEKPEETKPQYDAKTQQALDLVAALEDPTRVESIVEYLAARANLKVEKKGATKEEATDSVLATLKKNIPEQYQFLADALAPGIEKVLEQSVKSHTKPLQDQIQAQQVTMVQKEVDTTLDWFRANKEEFPNFKKLEKRIDELSQKYTMGPTATLKEYIADLYTIADRDSVKGSTATKVVERITRNIKQDTKIPAAEATEIRKGSALPSLDEAVRAAMGGNKI